MKLLRLLLLLLGVTLLGVLVAKNDPAEIFASIGRLSWRLAVIVAFPFALVTVADTLGWRFAFRRDRVGFGTLLGARLAGEAFNLTTPTAALGGEAVKTWLLRGRVPFDESLQSVVAAKTTILMAQGLFLIVGIVVARAVVPDSALLRGMVWLLLVEVLAVAGFVLAQTRGMFGSVQRLLQRIRLRPPGSGATLQRVDRGLLAFYSEEPRRLLLSIGFHLVGWLLGAIEAYVILRFLGVEVSLTTATVIEALGTGVRFATFMIPASVGFLEGGYVATFGALGLGSTVGISFGLTRRVREIAWIGAGLVVFAVMRERPGRSAAPTPTV
jgi:uncharacterized protein (TIRG00374 family)